MMKTRRDFLRLAGLAGAAACGGCAAGSGGGGGGGSWTEREIDILNATASRNGGRGWAAWEGKRQVAAWNPESRGPALSITKSIAALAASRAVSEGWLSPSERVAESIPEWRGDSQKSRITVLMLLQQVSGLESGVIALYRNHPADKGRAAVALRCVDAPGTVFRYGPSHWEVLAEVMRRKLSVRKMSVYAFVGDAVMRPVGLYQGNWRSDSKGTPYFSTGSELSVIELGRLGETISQLLHSRSAEGFNASHFAEVSRPSAVNPMFGGGLWRNTEARYSGAASIEVERSIDEPLPASFWQNACLSTRQPSECAALIGSGGRRVYLWPETDRRVARLGSSSSWSDAAFLNRLPTADPPRHAG